jgi:hypothetical protein
MSPIGTVGVRYRRRGQAGRDRFRLRGSRESRTPGPSRYPHPSRAPTAHGRGLMPLGRRARLARKSRPFRLNEKRGLSGSASPLEVSRWLRSRGHFPGLFVDRQIEHRQITRAPRDCSLVRIDQTCFGRSGGLAPTSLPLCQGTRFDAAGAGFSLSCSHSPRLVGTTRMASAQTFSRVGRRPVTEEQPPSRSQKLAAEIDPEPTCGYVPNCKRQGFNPLR